MSDEKKDYIPGRIEEWIHSDKESDQPVESVSETPEDLTSKTMEALDKPIKFEITRWEGPNSEEFRRAVAEFRRKKYVPLSKEEPKEGLLYRIFKYFKK